MNYVLETEFKNILSPEEYHKLLTHFKLDQQTANEQNNLYFDTASGQLKEAHAALRLRLTPSYAHLTFKQKFNSAQSKEVTDSLPLPLGQTIWQTGQLEIGPHVQEALVELGIEPADLQILGRFHTKRLSGEWQGNTLVLDACHFPNFNDFELEMESPDSLEEAEKAFHRFLSTYHIPRRPSKQKVARMLLSDALYSFKTQSLKKGGKE